MSDSKTEPAPVTCELLESAQKARDDARARATHLQRIINVKAARLEELVASNTGHLKELKRLNAIVNGFGSWLMQKVNAKTVAMKDVNAKWTEVGRKP